MYSVSVHRSSVNSFAPFSEAINKKQHSNFCQGAEVAGAVLEAGEGSGACNGIQAHPIPDLTQGCTEGQQGPLWCHFWKFGWRRQGTSVPGPTPWGVSQPCLFLPPWGKKSKSITFTVSCRKWLPEVLRCGMGLSANQGKEDQYPKVGHFEFHPSRSTSEFYPSRIPMLPRSQDLCEQEAELPQGSWGAGDTGGSSVQIKEQKQQNVPRGSGVPIKAPLGALEEEPRAGMSSPCSCQPPAAHWTN